MNIHELVAKSKKELIKVCEANYDNFWRNKILESTKAISFNKFKVQIKLEPHLQMNIAPKHKIALSRFRLSNHQLMIEKGTHLNINRNDRNCLFCKNVVI